MLSDSAPTLIGGAEGVCLTYLDGSYPLHTMGEKIPWTMPSG